jgi:hypothetical protein
MQMCAHGGLRHEMPLDGLFSTESRNAGGQREEARFFEVVI